MDFKSKLKLTGTARTGLCERFASLISEIPDDMFDRYVDAGYLDDVFDDVMDDYEDEEEWLDERASEDELDEESDIEDLAEVETQENLAIQWLSKLDGDIMGRIRIDARLA
ncbi:unnamed protein product [Blepharisma stoltei]|uniref:Uncharacterized protein n=1 Tax=Blepharisma stoltei TaxID=1481888 RepID=A0AAU9J3A7_9CILI|nr:unnamed protein product [Blepharisma stoltei]